MPGAKMSRLNMSADPCTQSCRVITPNYYSLTTISWENIYKYFIWCSVEQTQNINQLHSPNHITCDPTDFSQYFTTQLKFKFYGYWVELRDRKKSFRNFFFIMLPKVSHSPGPHESIAPNSPAKF